MTISEYNKTVDMYADNVYRFIFKSIGDKAKAQDIVQDTFEKLWIKKDIVSYEKAKSYLFTASYHTMIDLIRKEKRATNFEIYSSIKNYETNSYSDLNDVLHEGLKRLPESQRSALLLYDYEGYSYKEIAEITGMSESQVKVYIYRGRIALRKYIVKLDIVL